MVEPAWELVFTAAPTLHGSGTFDSVTLKALVRYAESREITCSAETGSGASTIVLSRCAKRHVVFSVDAANSITAVRQSGLLLDNVQWIEGPTQLTLPRHRFEEPLQFALIDGPHAWPFPDMEYYYLYQHIETGGILVIDDIQIPTIRNMFEVVSAEPMWRTLEVVHQTAFLERTPAPTFCPIGDYWWEQRYNKSGSKRECERPLIFRLLFGERIRP
jgi:hypothetical protein